MLVQLQVSAHPLLRLSSQSTSTKHYTAQTSELLAKMVRKTWFWFVFNFSGSEKLHLSHACILTMLNPSG